MLAAINNAAEVVRLLLDAGANVNVKDAFGQTALDYAKLKGDEEIITMLEAAAAAQ